MFKVINRNTITRCEICLKLTIKTPTIKAPELRQWRRSGVFIVGVFIVNFNIFHILFYCFYC